MLKNSEHMVIIPHIWMWKQNTFLLKDHVKLMGEQMYMEPLYE